MDEVGNFKFNADGQVTKMGEKERKRKRGSNWKGARGNFGEGGASVSLDWVMVTWGHRHVSKLVELKHLRSMRFAVCEVSAK